MTISPTRAISAAAQRRAAVQPAGEAVAYAMFNLEDRGPMIIEPGDKVYQGMIIGIHTRDNDLEVNVLKGKQLTNIRPPARTRPSS
jgi:predicted membrane GTPase involved in stress response